MSRRKVRKKVAHRKKLQNRFSMFLVSFAVLALIIIVGAGAYGLVQERDALLAEKEANALLIEKEQQRALEIEEYGKYTQTLKYYEEMAKTRLGLVYEDEIIFIQEN